MGEKSIDKKFVILAADDEMELPDALQLFVEREGMELIKTDNGISALALFEKHQPDLVLLDVMMPGLDGFALLKKIRETSRVPALRSEEHTSELQSQR